MRSYVINLARSPERRHYMEAQLSRTTLDWEFVDAVDGRALTPAEEGLVAVNLLDWAPRDWRAVAACALSHLKVAAAILATGDPVALVLEDDIILPPDVGEISEEIAPHMAAAEVVLLCSNSPPSARRREPYRFTDDGAVKLASGRSLLRPVDVRDASLACAYLVTREACVRMLAGAIPIRAPADDWAGFCLAGLLDRLRCVVPMPVKTQEWDTTIPRRAPTTMIQQATALIIDLPGFRTLTTHRRRRRRARLMDRVAIEIIPLTLPQAHQRPPILHRTTSHTL
jgi:glycosyl transferase family 25